MQRNKIRLEQLEIADFSGIGGNDVFIFYNDTQMYDWFLGIYDRLDGRTPDQLKPGNLLLLIRGAVSGFWWTGDDLREIGSGDIGIDIGKVTTRKFEDGATVVNSGTRTDVVLDFGIPSGKDGLPPYISNNNTWMIYNHEYDIYVDTNISVKGDAGEPATITIVDTITGDPGGTAKIENINTGSDKDTNLQLIITLPRGLDGVDGANNINIKIGNVYPLDSSSAPEVTIEGPSDNMLLNFGLPIGKNGKTPYIGDNGNWFTYDSEIEDYTDTDVKAAGTVIPSSIEVVETVTGDPGTQALIENINTGIDKDINLKLKVTIPRGLDGIDGANNININVGTVEKLLSSDDPYVEINGPPDDLMIDFGIPAGPVPVIEIGRVITGDPGTLPNVELIETIEGAQLVFTIPRPLDGIDGANNITVRIGNVEYLPAGYEPTVDNSGTSTDVILDFGLPSGRDGKSPFIDENSGNWFEYNHDIEDFEDTGTHAEGPIGKTPTIDVREVIWGSPLLPPKVDIFQITDGIELQFTIPKNPNNPTVSVELNPTITLPPDQSAYVENTGDEQSVFLTFGIPQGKEGKPPYIGKDNHWFTWDQTTQKYIDTGVVSKGRGVYSLYEEDGILYYLDEDGNEAPFEYDSTSGWLYYIMPDGIPMPIGKINARSPYLSETYNWIVWNEEERKYIDSGISAKGRGVYGIWTEDGWLYYLDEDGEESPFEYNELSGILYYKVDGEKISLGRVKGYSPYLSENNTWIVWNEEVGQLIDTGVSAKGRGVYHLSQEDGYLYFLPDNDDEINPFTYDENSGLLYYTLNSETKELIGYIKGPKGDTYNDEDLKRRMTNLENTVGSLNTLLEQRLNGG